MSYSCRVTNAARWDIDSDQPRTVFTPQMHATESPLSFSSPFSLLPLPSSCSSHHPHPPLLWLYSCTLAPNRPGQWGALLPCCCYPGPACVCVCVDSSGLWTFFVWKDATVIAVDFYHTVHFHLVDDHNCNRWCNTCVCVSFIRFSYSLHVLKESFIRTQKRSDDPPLVTI